LAADILRAKRISYSDLAFRILSPFFPEFDGIALQAAIEASSARFDTPEVAPLLHRGSYHFLELFHGPTLAFKDIALTLMGGLTQLARESLGAHDELAILVATSGDTGKAALAGFSDMPGVRIVVFYPAKGVSAVQRLQMVSHEASNASVIGIEGSFDDAQRGVKSLFADTDLAKHLAKSRILLSSANSINVARLLPQVVYYVKAWRDLMERSELGPNNTMDVAVPTGNFGNILAARYAKLMGLPIRRLVCASNRNNVLTDFFETGIYDRVRPFFVTTSPSMDILVSSNLERMIFEATRRNSTRTAELMAGLSTNGRFALSESEHAAFADFGAGWADEKASAQAMRKVFADTGYLIDPHTAVAVAVMERLRGHSDDGVPIVVSATASPFKFPATVAEAIGLHNAETKAPIASSALTEETDALAELDLAERIADHAGLELPPAVRELRDKPRRHATVIAPDRMKAALIDILER
jgi:threonine synthase